MFCLAWPAPFKNFSIRLVICKPAALSAGELMRKPVDRRCEDLAFARPALLRLLIAVLAEALVWIDSAISSILLNAGATC
ncbi:Uncharacterised protein [Yersinia pseudotuberculosis]|nr:Uncharacterised protein [Yersinia pseudotuberculosis]CRY71225.1 Uncharacterised protein [Yersinia pseudotuberculosis]